MYIYIVIYIIICIYIYNYIHIYIYTHTYTHIYIYLYTYIHIHTHTYICIHWARRAGCKISFQRREDASSPVAASQRRDTAKMVAEDEAMQQVRTFLARPGVRDSAVWRTSFAVRKPPRPVLARLARRFGAPGTSPVLSGSVWPMHPAWRLVEHQKAEYEKVQLWLDCFKCCDFVLRRPCIPPTGTTATRTWLSSSEKLAECWHGIPSGEGRCGPARVCCAWDHEHPSMSDFNAAFWTARSKTTTACCCVLHGLKG